MTGCGSLQNSKATWISTSAVAHGVAYSALNIRTAWPSKKMARRGVTAGPSKGRAAPGCGCARQTS